MKKTAASGFLRYDATLWENLRLRRGTGWETSRILRRPREGSGEYRVELRDEQGKTLVYSSPYVDFGHLCTTGAELRRQRVVCYVPWRDEARELVFRRGELILDRATLAASPPVVKITSCKQAKDGNVELRWSAEHEKDRSLSFRVACMVDGRRGFLLAKDLTEPRFVTSLVDIPAGKDVHLGVLATDGLRSGVAVSDGFSLPERAPSVRILSPDASLAHPAGQPLGLIGNAFDVASATLPAKPLVWRFDGEVAASGTSTAVLPAPAPGKHRVSLQMVDGKKKVLAEAAVDFVVAEPNEALIRYAKLKAEFEASPP